MAKKKHDEPTELLSLDAVEVSMVDRAAIKRRFVTVKAHNDAASETETAVEDPPEVETVETTTEKSEPVQATGLTVTEDVEKAVTPVLESLVSEFLTIVQSNAEAVQAALKAGTLTKEDAWSRLWAIHDAAYKVSDNVSFVAKSLGVEADLGTEEVPTEKSYRKMTQRRKDAVKSAIVTLESLMLELETPMATETTETETVETSKAKPTETTETSQAAVAPPVVETQKIDVAKAIEDAVSAATKAAATTVETAVAKAMEKFEQRLGALEGTPGTPAANQTETVTTAKSDKDTGVWGGKILGR